MKSFIGVVVWTLLFIVLGLFVESDLSNFINSYDRRLDSLEGYISNSNYELALDEVLDISRDLNHFKGKWYKLVDHTHYNEVLFCLEVLEDQTTLKDESLYLEYINRIRYAFVNILQDEICDLNHIL